MTELRPSSGPRVVVFRADLLPVSETFIKDQILALSQWDAVLTGLRQVHGLDISRLRSKILSGWAPHRLSRRVTAAFRELDLAPWGMTGQLSRLAGDIIHVHFGVDLVAIWPVLRRLGRPVVTTLHGWDVNIRKEHWYKRGYVDRQYPDRLLSIAAHPRVTFVAVSEALARRAVQFGIPREKIVVKHIGVDAARFTPTGVPVTERRQRILYVGRMFEKKGGPILIRAFAQVCAHVPGAELVMIGDGPLLHPCRQLAESLQLPVRFMGACPAATVRQQLAEARVFCLPSIVAQNGDAEGLPISLLEAQACGVPVVTSASGNAEAVMDGVTGFCFPEQDIDALSARLTRLLCDDELALSMSAAGPKFIAERFDIRRCTRALEDLYQSLL